MYVASDGAGQLDLFVPPILLSYELTSHLPMHVASDGAGQLDLFVPPILLGYELTSHLPMFCSY